jgi:cytochrome c553
LRNKFGFGIIAFATVWTSGLSVAAEPPPPWAYGFAQSQPPDGAPPRAPGGRGAGRGQTAPDETVRHLPGSDGAFTYAQLYTHFAPGPGDWFPGDHPSMPEVVAQGRRPDVHACASCHYPNGKGKSENAGVAGLPVSYFIQTMDDFRNGLRKSSDRRKGNTNTMASIAKAMTDDEIKAAAEYFGSIKWTPWIRVIESDTVAKTRVQSGMFLVLEGNEKEPLGARVLETPVDAEQTEMYKNPRSGFLAYVPVGSLKKGEKLVATGAGKTTQCGLCHGADLRGLGPVPGLAGRSPSYMMRQLCDMQVGNRRGPWAELMKPVVAGLSNDDMLAIVAYTASLAP